MNQRLLIVKGMGNVTAKPDMVIIRMDLTNQQRDYTQTMEAAGKNIESMRQALISLGYKRDTLKTTDFKISTEYENIRHSNGDYTRQFMGYKCTHELKLEIDFDMKRLGEALAAVSSCGANPALRINFSVKDKTTVSAALLESAISNAKDKAAILARSAGVTLGAIQRIDYNWGELRLYSSTRPHFDNSMEMSCAIDIEPDDIDVDDTVTVVWAIE